MVVNTIYRVGLFVFLAIFCAPGWGMGNLGKVSSSAGPVQQVPLVIDLLGNDNSLKKAVKLLIDKHPAFDHNRGLDNVTQVVFMQTVQESAPLQVPASSSLADYPDGSRGTQVILALVTRPDFIAAYRSELVKVLTERRVQTIETLANQLQASGMKSFLADLRRKVTHLVLIEKRRGELSAYHLSEIFDQTSPRKATSAASVGAVDASQPGGREISPLQRGLGQPFWGIMRRFVTRNKPDILKIPGIIDVETGYGNMTVMGSPVLVITFDPERTTLEQVRRNFGQRVPDIRYGVVYVSKAKKSGKSAKTDKIRKWQRGLSEYFKLAGIQGAKVRLYADPPSRLAKEGAPNVISVRLPTDGRVGLVYDLLNRTDFVSTLRQVPILEISAGGKTYRNEIPQDAHMLSPEAARIIKKALKGKFSVYTRPTGGYPFERAWEVRKVNVRSHEMDQIMENLGLTGWRMFSLDGRGEPPASDYGLLWNGPAAQRVP